MKFNIKQNLAKEIVSEIDKKVKRNYWTNEDIDKYFGKRSADEIIKNGSTCFMNPCLDLTLASAKILNINMIPYNFIIEEIAPTKDFNFNRLHFILEFRNRDSQYQTINYVRCNDVEISNNKYTQKTDLPLIKTIKINGEKINPGKTIYESLCYENLEDLLNRLFPDYSLDSNLSRLKKDNSPENYKGFIAKYGTKFLIKELQNQPSI